MCDDDNDGTAGVGARVRACDDNDGPAVAEGRGRGREGRDGNGGPAAAEGRVISDGVTRDRRQQWG